MQYLHLISSFLQSSAAWPVYLVGFLALIFLTVKEPAERFRIIAMSLVTLGLLYGFYFVLVRYFHVDPKKFEAQFRYNSSDPLLFNSAFFLYFFTLFLLFFLLVHKQKLTRVVVFSVFSLFFFYKACGWYVIFILIAAVVDFFLSNAIWKSPDKKTKTILLVISLVLNLGLLFFFKYTNFYIEMINGLTGGHVSLLHLALPVGISFYTFENLSYTLDVYRGHFKPVTKFFDYLFFLSFFPKLMMGPIVRASDFIPQIRQDIHVSKGDVGAGLYLILSGIFKKVVISDFIWLNFGQYIFDDPSKHSGVECLFGVYCYALVIYCDFSGYSDMAIGMARWMGFKIPANFDSPYQSSSITEFWRRWHISLSSWLRDYLYISLGGNRRGSVGTWIVSGIFFISAGIASVYAGIHSANWWPLMGLGFVLAFIFTPVLLFRNEKNAATTSLNQLNTMLLGGLWHGASWNFLFWGFLHGIALSFDKIRLKVVSLFPFWLKKFFEILSHLIAANIGFMLFNLIGRMLFGTAIAGTVFGIAMPVIIFLVYRLNKEKLNTKRIIGVLITFHFVCLCWIYFKCETFEQASILIGQIWNNFAPGTFRGMLSGYSLVFQIMGAAFLMHLFLTKEGEEEIQARIGNMPVYAKILIVITLVWLIVQFKQAEQMLPIYLQF